MIEVKITKIGNEYGIVLNTELLQQLNAGPGSTVFVSSEYHTIQSLSPALTETELQELVERILNERADVLSKLAK